MKRLAGEYTRATGLDPKKEHPEWNAAHRVLLGAGIPTIEQVGGDVDVVKGKRATLAATPWKFEHGDACQVRFVAMCDPSGTLRIEPGN
jgi:kynurenine formamidase